MIFSNKDSKVITIILIYNFFFFYLRFIYLFFDVENSYIYYYFNNYKPQNSCFITIFSYSILLIGFIYFYLKGSHVRIIKEYSLNVNIRIIHILFLVSVFIELYRTIILGNHAGKATIGSFFKILFFVQWVFSFKIYGFLLFCYTKKYRYLLIVALLIILSGMKSGLFYVLLFWFFYLYYFNLLNRKKVISFIIILLLFISIFPILFILIGKVRQGDSFSFNLLYSVIKTIKADYFSFLFIVIKFIIKRMNLYDFYHMIVLNYDLLPRKNINSITGIVHLYNEFVPAFLESKDLYLGRSINYLYPVIFFNQSIIEVSSEAVTIPGLILLYNGYLFSIIYISLLGFVIGLIHNSINRVRNTNLNDFFNIYFFVFIFGFIQSGSISSMILLIKEFCSLIFILSFFNLLKIIIK